MNNSPIKARKKYVNVYTPVARAQYVYLSQPDTGEIVKKDGTKTKKDGKYKLTLLFPKGSDLKALEDAVVQAAKDKWGETVDMAKVQTPFVDGDTCLDREGQPWEGFPGHIAIKADRSVDKNTNLAKPIPCYGKDGTSIIDPSEIYAGCKVKAKLAPFALVSFGSIKMVKFYCEGVQFAGDDEPFVTGQRDSGGFEPITEEVTF